MNKVLTEMQQIRKPIDRDHPHMMIYVHCDMCHYNAWYSYLYEREKLYRCMGHKIIDIHTLKSKWGYGSE